MPSNQKDRVLTLAKSKKESAKKIIQQTGDWAEIGRDFVGDLYPLTQIIDPLTDGLRKADAVIDTVTGVLNTATKVIDTFDRAKETLDRIRNRGRNNGENEEEDVPLDPAPIEDEPPSDLPTDTLPNGPDLSTVPPITLAKIDTSDSIIQKEKLLQIYTVYPVDTFLLQSLNGTSGTSSLFEYQLLIISKEQQVPFDNLIGTQILARIALPDGTYRPLHGIVKSMTAEEKSRGEYAAYKITIAPKLHFSQLNSTNQIFLDRTLPEIVDETLRDQGLIPETDYEWKLTRKLNEYRITEQTTQYNETYFNFISRLLEKEGIYYYFEHIDLPTPGHKIIFVDSMDKIPACPTLGWVKVGQKKGKRNTAHSNNGTVPWFQVEQTVGIQSYKHRDWNFSIPNRFFGEYGTDPTYYEPWIAKTKWRERDIYTYPGDYKIHQNGEETQLWADHYAQIRYEEAISQNSTHAVGIGNCTGLQTGYKVLIRSSDIDTEETGNEKIYNQEYFILAAREEATVGTAYQAGSYVNDQKQASYEVHFTAIPADLPFRPPQITPVPRIYGLQTAIVVPETDKQGDPNSEIFTDEYKRIKVKFHWDLRPESDDRSSCWLRVATPLSGVKWGTVFIPRVGMEVLVGFEDGNPDKPLVVGSLYNESHRPPYDLPQHKTRSTIKTHSTLNGTSENFNELRFEDKKGNEQVFLNAERDLDINIEEDYREHTHRQKNIVTCGEHREFIKGKFSQTVSNDQDVAITANYSINVGQKLSIKANEIHFEANSGITFHVGGSTISLWPDRIEIEGGPYVKINMGSSQVGLKAASPASPEVADNGQFGGPNTSSNCSNPEGSELEEADLDTSGTTKTEEVPLLKIQSAQPSNQRTIKTANSIKRNKTRTNLGTSLPRNDIPPTQQNLTTRIKNEIDEIGNEIERIESEITENSDWLKTKPNLPILAKSTIEDRIDQLRTQKEFLKERLDQITTPQ